MNHYVPKGFQQVIPYFIVEDGERFIDFLKKSFEALELERHLDEHGGIMNSVFRIGDSIIEMGEGNEKYPPRKNTIHIYLADTDKVYRNALEAGGISIYEPEDMSYGERSAGVEDPFGNHWYIATYQG